MAFETEDLVKWGLVGFGAYWVYTNMIAVDQPAAAIPPSGPEAPPVPDNGGAQTGQSAPAPPPPGARDTAGAPAPPPGGQTGAPVPRFADPGPGASAQQLRVQAAIDPNFAASYNPADKLNQHQWNWYRQQGGRPISSAALSNDPNNYTMTAAEYHQRLSQVGLSGMGHAHAMPHYSM